MGTDHVLISARRGIEQPWSARLSLVRRLTVAWAKREIRVRYRQSVLRSSWSILQPVAVLATYGWVLTAVLDVSREDAPYLTFAWAGITCFTYFAQTVGQGVGSIQQNAHVVSRVYMPLEVLPLAVVLAGLADLIVMTILMVATAWIQIGPPSVHLLGVLPAFALLAAWSTAATVAAAGINVFRRDLNFAIPLLLRLGFIITPVMYSANLLNAQSHLIVDLNPLAVVIEATRDSVYRHRWPEWSLIAAHFAIALVATACVLIAFRRAEPRMSDTV